MISSDFRVVDKSGSLTIGFHRLTGINRYRTICCALGMLSMNNETTLDRIKTTIESIQKETTSEKDSISREGGERAILVITLPSEEILAENLDKFGFKEIAEFRRRDCYPEEDRLKMWIYSW